MSGTSLCPRRFGISLQSPKSTMSFDWQSLIPLARTLIQPQDEARNRTCVNRAYYAAFCTLRDHLGLQDNRKDVHDALIQALSSLRTPVAIEVSGFKWTLENCAGVPITRPAPPFRSGMPTGPHIWRKKH